LRREYPAAETRKAGKGRRAEARRKEPDKAKDQREESRYQGPGDKDLPAGTHKAGKGRQPAETSGTPRWCG